MYQCSSKIILPVVQVFCITTNTTSQAIYYLQELSENVKHYHEAFEVQDKKEWNSVITELKSFSAVNCIVRIAGDDGKLVNPTHRCSQVCN